MALILNALIFAITLLAVLSLFRRGGQWAPGRGIRALRFFTVLSNILCGIGALAMCLWPSHEGVWRLKYVGTAAVTVTLLTVVCFLGPTQGYRRMFRGSDLFMHLVTPALALVSFCEFERRGLSFSASMLGMIPVLLYGVVYLYKVVFAPVDRRWEDFYGFNRGGKWPLSFAAMVAGALLVCIGLWAGQTL